MTATKTPVGRLKLSRQMSEDIVYIVANYADQDEVWPHFTVWAKKQLGQTVPISRDLLQMALARLEEDRREVLQHQQAADSQSGQPKK